MGVYIKGMEMPKNCAKCKLFGEYGCPFVGAVGYALTRGERNEDCPLIPIPPHGDLIDRNELEENCMKEDSFLAELLFRKVSNAPTIIPAEEGET